MANPDATVSESEIDASSELFINNSDSISFLLATGKLNGDNYSQWHR